MSDPGRFGPEYYARTFTLDEPSRFSPAWWSVAYYARLVRRLLVTYGGRRVLEIGCGQGQVLARMQDACDATGLDISEFAIERARARAPRARCFVADVGRALPPDVRPGTYDVVLARYVLEHVPDPPHVLRALFACVRPGGALLFSVPNTLSPGKRLKGPRWFGYGDPTHISLLEPAEWLEHTRAAGFVVRRTFSDGLWDVPYVPHVPRIVQYALFSLPSMVSVAFALPLLPVGWGENLIVIAERPLEDS